MPNQKTDLTENRSLALFQDKEIRRTWKYNKWFFVVEDVIVALTDSTDPKQYITRMKERDSFIREGWVQIVRTLKIQTRGGMQKMNCAVAYLTSSIPLTLTALKIWCSSNVTPYIQQRQAAPELLTFKIFLV